MDHLQLPTNAQHAHIEIPYLAAPHSNKEPYDNGDFLSYVDRREGWTIHDVLKPGKSQKTQRDLAEVVQTWLFFGILRQVFGELLRQLDFVTLNQYEEQVLTTTPLWQLWHAYAQNVDSDKQQQSRSHIERSIALAAGVVGEIHVELEETIEPLERVLLSVLSLCDNIQVVLDPNNVQLPSRQWPLSDLLLERSMKSDGWCESDIRRLTQMLDLSSLYFVSRMKPRDPSRHKSCDNVRCVANDVLGGGYKREHHNCQSCKDRCAVSEDIFEVLQARHLPLIHPEQHDESSLRLTSTEKVRNYIAISHIWSDGLGNPERNAIYGCQLTWLQGLSKQFSDDGMPIWLDTISCPIDSEQMTEQAKRLYHRAIAFMRRTYAEADIVLVLDHSLLDIVSANLTCLEIMLHIVTCGWTRRLWTYHEGVLAKRLFFQFADQAIDIDRVYEAWQNDALSLYYPSIRGAYDELRILKDIDQDGFVPRILHRVSRPLTFRKTSVASDEALCLATLANLSPECVQVVCESPEDHRMQTFYSCLPQLSRQLIFWYGSRLTSAGYKWTPASFLNNGNVHFADLTDVPLESAVDDRSATLSPEGLRFEGPGIFLGTWKANFQSFLFTTPLGIWYHVTCRQFKGDRPFPFRMVRPTNTQSVKFPDMSLALLTQEPLNASFAIPGFESRLGLMVVISVQNEETYYAQTLCPAFIFRKMHIDTEFPLVKKTYQFYKAQLGTMEDGNTPNHNDTNNEDAWLLEDETLIDQYKKRGPTAILENIRDYGPGEPRDRLWAGTCMSNGKFSLVREDMHNLFEGTEIPETQKWCLD